MVQSSWNIVWLSLLYPNRYVVHRLHFCWNAFWDTIIHWRGGNGYCFLYFKVFRFHYGLTCRILGPPDPSLFPDVKFNMKAPAARYSLGSLFPTHPPVTLDLLEAGYNFFQISQFQETRHLRSTKPPQCFASFITSLFCAATKYCYTQ